jgi:hypothetical protein
MASIAMHGWLRIVLVASVVILVKGAALCTYRWYFCLIHDRRIHLAAQPGGKFQA